MGGRFLNGILAGAVFGAAILLALSLISPPPPREEAPPEPAPEVADTATEAPAQSGVQPEELPEAPAQGQGGQEQGTGMPPPLGLLDPSGTLHSPGYPSEVDSGAGLLFPPPLSLIPGEGPPPALPGPPLAEGAPAAAAQPAQPPDLATGTAPAALVPGLIAGDTVPPGAPGGDSPAAGSPGVAVPADVPSDEVPQTESDPGDAPAELADESQVGTANATESGADSPEGAVPLPDESADSAADTETVPDEAVGADASGAAQEPAAGTGPGDASTQETPSPAGEGAEPTPPEATPAEDEPASVDGAPEPSGIEAVAPDLPANEAGEPEKVGAEGQPPAGEAGAAVASPEAAPPETPPEAAASEAATPETLPEVAAPEATTEIPAEVTAPQAGAAEPATAETGTSEIPPEAEEEATTPDTPPEAATGEDATGGTEAIETPSGAQPEAAPEGALPESSSEAAAPEAESPEAAMPDEAQTPEVRRIIPGEGTSTLPSTPPLIAPDPAVTEDSAAAGLPPADEEAGAASADAAAGPLNDYAAPFDNPGGKPVLSIILIDTGEAALDRAALAALPFPVTFALDPLDPASTGHAAIYRAAGKEVAMLATGFPKGAQASDVEVALAAMELALPEAVAVMDLPERRFQADRPLASLVVPAVSASGRGLLSWNEGLNAAEQVAEREGAPAAVIFRNLDGEGEAAPAIARYLDRAVFKAAQEGAVIVAGHTRPETVAALLEWSIGARAALVALAPASAILRQGDGG